jgi:PAS domain S-box-containing protein
MHEMLAPSGHALAATLGLLPRVVRRAFHHPGILFGVLGIFFVWAGVGYSLSVERQAALDSAFNETGNLALAFEEQIAGIVRAIDQTLLYVRASYVRAPEQFDITPWSERGEFLTHPAFQVLIGDKDGYLRLSSLVQIKSPLYVGDRDYFLAQAGASEDHLFIGKPVVGRLSNKWSIQFTRPILGPGGSFAGVVVVSFDPFYLSHFYESLHLSSEGVVVLLGADGVIRARAPNGQQTIGLSVADTPLKGLLDGKAIGSLSEVSSIDGIKHIYSYRSLQRYPLAVGVGMSEDDALATYHKDRRSYLTVASITSSLLLLVLALFVRHQIRLDRTREALRGSEARYADKSRLLEITLDNMTQGIMMIDAGMTLQVSNKRAAELLDLPEALLAARPLLAEVVRPAWQRGEFGPCTEPFEIWFDGFLRAHSGLMQTEEHVHANGTILEICSKRLSDGGVVRTFTDVTERKQLDEALRQSRERLALATESARVGIWDWDIAANKLVWDARMYQLYGIREQDFSGAYDAWQKGLHPDDLARGDAAIAAAIHGVKDFNLEFRVVWPNGEVHDIEAHALVQGTAAEGATRMIGVNWDITERKHATETIRMQADEYAAMLATTSDGFWLLDRTGSFLAANDAYCRMSGRTRKELLALKISDVEAVEPAEVTNRHMATIIETGFDRFESQHLRKDGSLIDVEGSVSFWRETGRFLCFARDITDRKRAEQALADSEARLKTVLETNVDGIAMIDAETLKFSFANRAFCDFLGYSLDGVTALGVPDIHPPEALAEISECFASRVAVFRPAHKAEGRIDCIRRRERIAGDARRTDLPSRMFPRGHGTEISGGADRANGAL